MRPLFTIHAGEYLVGSHIEASFPKLNVWVPTKDTGRDLLVTNATATLALSLQVKFSKDFTPTYRTPLLQSKLAAGGWWTHQENKIKNSTADFWVFVLPSFTERRTHFIIIKPAELFQRLRAIHGTPKKKLHSYLWVTKSGHCWEARGLKNADQELLASDNFGDLHRDFTQFLDNWTEIEKRLSK
jgi:hypothetical protein